METLYRKYRRIQIAEVRPVVKYDIDCWNHSGNIPAYGNGYEKIGVRVSVSDTDVKNGSPKIGDMIARNPKNHLDQCLVAEQYFKDNFALMDDDPIAQLQADKAELLEALEQSNLQIEYLHEKFKETASGNAVVSGNNYLIKKHKICT